MLLYRKLRLLASRVDIINIFRRGHLPLWGLVFQSHYHLKKNLLAFRHCYVTMSMQRPITKKSYVTCKKPLNALSEKRLQSSMFKWPSFYYFLKFHCKILNSYAIYRCKKMVKILNCYLDAKKVMALCLRVQFFLANSVNIRFFFVLYIRFFFFFAALSYVFAILQRQLYMQRAFWYVDLRLK